MRGFQLSNGLGFFLFFFFQMVQKRGFQKQMGISNFDVFFIFSVYFNSENLNMVMNYRGKWE